MTTSPRLPTGTDQDLKRWLAARFPDWNIIVSDKGRWWATRVPPRDDPCRISDASDDSPAGLYLQLTDIESGAAKVPSGSSVRV